MFLLFSWQIERLQNVHLRDSYEVQKKRISDNRRQEGGAREKLLYHGTTQENCDSIMKTGFNRRFAGQNGKDRPPLSLHAHLYPLTSQV